MKNLILYGIDKVLATVAEQNTRGSEVKKYGLEEKVGYVCCGGEGQGGNFSVLGEMIYSSDDPAIARRCQRERFVKVDTDDFEWVGGARRRMQESSRRRR